MSPLACVAKTSCNDRPLKAATHPCSSFEVADLVYIGKPKGGKDFRLMMALTDHALKKIAETIGGDRAGVAP